MMFALPGSKSYTNRALIMAALTQGAVTLRNPLYCDDTEAMMHSLQTLGIVIEKKEKELIVFNDLSSIKKGSYSLFANEGGTTLRFLLPFLCLVPGVKTIQGTARLNERPIEGLLDGLRQLGADISSFPPFIITSAALAKGATITLDSQESSQFLSALLMIAPLLGLTIKVKQRSTSVPYVMMTLEMMKEWGIVIEEREGEYYIPEGQSYQKSDYEIEGDFSSAAYFFAYAALKQSTITLSNLKMDSLQADRKFLDILIHMGNDMQVNAQEITFIGKGIKPVTVAMEECPDQVQTMAVLAAFAFGVTRISGIRALRHKECDRVQAIHHELKKMGITTTIEDDAMTIYGGSPSPARIDTYKDHRMAMSFAVAKAQFPAMEIVHPEVVRKSFPSFWEYFNRL